MIENRVIIVTGGAQGIGAAIAKRFIESGFVVVIADNNAKKGQETANHIGAEFHCADVSFYSDCFGVVDFALQKFGRIDVVVANAGKNDGLSTEEASTTQWENSIQLNLTSVFNTCKPALKHLPNGGRIIAISSVVGVVGQAHNGPYGAAKAGIIGYMKNLALELASRGITANAICPNAVDTPLLYDWARQQPDGEATTLDRMKERIPLRRWLLPEEVADCVFFLASPSASYITGQAIIMDGGYSLG